MLVLVGTVAIGVGCGDQVDNGGQATAIAPSTVTTTGSTAPVPTGTAPNGPVTSSSPSTTTTSAAGGLTPWVASDLPAGFEATLVQEQRGIATIFYADPRQPGDLFDAPLRVVNAPTDRYAQAAILPRQDIEVAGHGAIVLPLFDDGKVFGVVITWQTPSGGWVAVEAANPLTEADALAVAEGLRAAGQAEWDQLRRGLSIGTHVGRPEPDATPVAVIERRIGTDPYVLTALIPAGYPLGPTDRRAMCYSLSFRGQTSPVRCDTHPWRLRVGGQLFAFGPAADDSNELVIKPSEGQTGSPLQTAAVKPPAGPPGAFYAQPLPEGLCWIEVQRVDGTPDPNLGPSGPLPDDPEHAGCLAAIGKRPLSEMTIGTVPVGPVSTTAPAQR